MRREAIDFFTVRPEHYAIHGRLLNWSKVVRLQMATGKPSPMFRHYRSSDVWASSSGEAADEQDGWKMEKEIQFLPDKHRTAVRWHYVRSTPPGRVCRILDVTPNDLRELVHDARTMLRNRTRGA